MWLLFFFGGGAGSGGMEKTLPATLEFCNAAHKNLAAGWDPPPTTTPVGNGMGKMGSLWEREVLLFWGCWGKSLQKIGS